MRNSSLILILGVMTLIFVAGYSGYLSFKKSEIRTEKKQNEAQIRNLEADILKYENQNLMSAVAAKQTVADLKGNSLLWSDVVQKIRKTVPKKDGLYFLDVTSYTGSTNNTLSLSVKTLPGGENPYFDVADFIQAFDESKNFIDNFVPSISAGKNDRGEEVLSFSFSTTYREANSQEEGLAESLNEILEDSLENSKTIKR